MLSGSLSASMEWGQGPLETSEPRCTIQNHNHLKHQCHWRPVCHACPWCISRAQLIVWCHSKLLRAGPSFSVTSKSRCAGLCRRFLLRPDFAHQESMPQGPVQRATGRPLTPPPCCLSLPVTWTMKAWTPGACLLRTPAFALRNVFLW